MARKLASIQIIKAIEPIPNADSLELATVLGWKCVVKKGEFAVNEAVCYFEIDSLLPVTGQFAFMAPRGTRAIEDGSVGYRLRIVRLRGQISEGLVMKTADFGYEEDELDEGTDLTETLGVKLWQPIIPACLRGKVKGTFPQFIPKTDETRVQLLGRVVQRNAGTICYVTEKVDGSSITCYLKDGVFGVASRNMDLDVNDLGTAYMKTVRKLDVEQKMRDAFGNVNVAIQGELIGTGIQDNRLNIEGHTIMWFNLFFMDDYRYAGFADFVYWMKAMNLTTVPVLETDYCLSADTDSIIQKAVGKSVVNPKSWREGIVIRPIDEKLDLEMSKGMGNARLSFKAINQEYILKNENA